MDETYYVVHQGVGGIVDVIPAPGGWTLQETFRAACRLAGWEGNAVSQVPTNPDLGTVMNRWAEAVPEVNLFLRFHPLEGIWWVSAWRDTTTLAEGGAAACDLPERIRDVLLEVTGGRG